jgi:hypothetical protein
MRRHRLGAARQQVGVVLQHTGADIRLGVLLVGTEWRVAVPVVGRDAEPPPRILAGTGRRFNAAGEAETVVFELECV